LLGSAWVVRSGYIILRVLQKATGSPGQLSGHIRFQTHGTNLADIPERTFHIVQSQPQKKH